MFSNIAQRFSKTTFSNSFEGYERRVMNLSFVISGGFVLRIGAIIPFFHSVGKMPVRRELLNIAARTLYSLVEMFFGPLAFLSGSLKSGV